MCACLAQPNCVCLRALCCFVCLRRVDSVEFAQLVQRDKWVIKSIHILVLACVSTRQIWLKLYDLITLCCKNFAEILTVFLNYLTVVK